MASNFHKAWGINELDLLFQIFGLLDLTDKYVKTLGKGHFLEIDHNMMFITSKCRNKGTS